MVGDDGLCKGWPTPSNRNANETKNHRAEIFPHGLTPKRMKLLKLAISATSLCLAMICGTAQASLIWTGDPSVGLSVFKAINIENNSGVFVSNPSPNGSSATVVTDGSEGSVFKWDKVSGDKRCEAHGAAGFTPAIGSTYYIGWRFKLTNLTNDNAVFQWKSYGSPMVQDFPLVCKMVNGKLELHYFPPNSGDVVLFSQTISANTYYSMVLKILVSDQTTGGSVSFWFNEAQQTLLTGGTSYTGKTFDGDAVDPKWGIYGANFTHVTDYVSHLKIGTTYADVDPGGSGGGGIDTSAIYQIQNEASGKVLNNQGSTTNGSPVSQWTSGSSVNLQWKFIATSGGYYQINSVMSGKDAVVQSASTAAGAKIIQWSFGSSGDDQWLPQSNSDGSFTFVNLHSGLVLGDPGSSGSNGTQMDQEASNGGSNQKWMLLKQ